MARRIPLSEAKKAAKSGKAKQPVEKGDETVVGLLPQERTFDIEVLEGPPVPSGTAPASAVSSGAEPWSPIASEPAGGWAKPAPSEQAPAAAPAAARPASVSWTRGQLPAWRQNVWKAFPVLALLLVVGVVIQVYLAGVTVFGAARTFEAHKVFVHVLELVPVLMIVAGFVGGRKAAGWWSVGLLAAIELQYAFAAVYELNATRNLQLVGALHVVNALFIFGVGLLLAKRYSPWMDRRAAA